MIQPTNPEENTSDFNWDNLLTDILEEIGPNESPNSLPAVEELDNAEPLTPNGTCIYCTKCVDIKLWYPLFPPTPYSTPIIQWMRIVVAPRMQHFRRCFMCVMINIMHSNDEFTIVDQILAEKMVHSIPDLVNMSHMCIHENIAETSENTEESPVEQPKEEIGDIRQILQNFRNRQNPENAE